jgi:hypothetical protein
MTKRLVRSRGLLVIVALAVVAAMCTAATARAASSSPGARSAAGARTANTAASSAPCDLRHTISKCQSTNPTVTVSTLASGGSGGIVYCTFVWDFSWGDGHSSQATLTDPQVGWRVTAQHTYAAPGVYTMTATGEAIGDNCTLTPFIVTFTLLQKQPSPAYSPTIYWSRTSGRPGTFVTLTGNGWAPGGTVKVHLPAKGFLIGNSSWHVNSKGGWKQKFTVAGTKPGKYALSFTESSGNLHVSGHFTVPSVPNAGQDWSRCGDGACTIAIDHQRTEVLAAILAGTPTSVAYYEAGRLCLAYLAPIARYCAIFAAIVVIDKNLLAKQLSENDNGHGVYITWLTINIRKLPGITPQK